MKTVGVFLLSSRPLSWVNTAYPFAFAYFVVEPTVDLRLVVGTLFFLIPYNLVMYGVNDVYDYPSDIQNPRKGGVEGALLPPALHRPMLVTAAIVSVPFVVVLMTLGSWPSWIALGAAMFFVVAYSAPGFRFKEIPFLDSVTSSLHFVAPAFYGITLAGGHLTTTGALVLGSFFLWGMASHAFGAVQDVVFDRGAGIGSIATVVGARKTVWLALLGYLLAGGLMAMTPWPLALIGLAALPYLAAVAPFWSITDATAQRANRGWRWFLAINFVAGAWATLVAIEAGVLPV